MPQACPASQGDWPQISALLTASALPLQGARQHIERFEVIREREAVIACAASERHGDCAVLRSVAVSKERRGEGLGTHVVQRVLDRLCAEGVQTVFLLTTTARDYFLRFGFEEIVRDAVPPAVRGSIEFTTACPASAHVMRLTLPAAGLIGARM